MGSAEHGYPCKKPHSNTAGHEALHARVPQHGMPSSGVQHAWMHRRATGGAVLYGPTCRTDPSCDPADDSMHARRWPPHGPIERRPLAAVPCGGCSSAPVGHAVNLDT